MIPPSEHVKLVRVTIDNALEFDIHVHGMCKKASQKIHGRLRLYIGMDKSELILNAMTLIDPSCGYEHSMNHQK